MKFKKILIIAILLTLPILALAQVSFPKPVGLLNDFAKALNTDTYFQLNSLLNELHQKTNVEFAVLIVDNMQGLDRDTYAVEIFKEWGIGSKKDEGLLFLLAIQERETKVEVGYELEGLINDSKAGRILDEYAMPSFRQNDFQTGIKNATIAFAQLIAEDKGITLTGSKSVRKEQKQDDDEVSNFTLFIILGVIVFLTIITKGRFLYWLLFALSRGGMGSRGGGSSGGGGFGGFGGGSSGGGGAGRRF
ncbi:MAG: TPM domain-containing protein [Candidatus Cloacimonadales bacterium]|jgi:uncharacterized protein|nr:TPM domain-containing protein [Candidatus Cloacimonadota bacterium]MDD3502018.1 TPM domain-containing protein [Candidatus Cloacimonadota bacterium]MDX9977707.1 TPM domain-containing protein [Candidatus Cloacimonadales bacterium]